MRTILSQRNSAAILILAISLGLVCGVAIGVDLEQTVAGSLLFLSVVTVWLCLEPEVHVHPVDALHPRLAFGVLFVLYFSLGSSNVGAYSGIRVQDWQWFLYGLALFSFVAGSWFVSLSARASTKSQWQSPQITPRYLQKVRTWRNALFVVGFIAVAVQAGTAGMPLLDARVARLTLPLVFGRAWPYLFETLTVAVVLACTILFIAGDSPRGQRIFDWLILLASLGMLTLFAARSLFVPGIVVSLVLYRCYRRRLPLRRLLMAGVVVLVVISLFGAWRSERSELRPHVQRELARVGVGGQYFWVMSWYPSFLNGPHVLAWTLKRVPTDIPFQDGKFFLGDVLTLLPGKQLQPGYWVTTNIMERSAIAYTASGVDIGPGSVPPSIVGGLWIDGGVPAVLIGCFLLGALLQWLYGRALSGRQPWVVVLYGLVLAFALLSLYSFLYLKLTEMYVWLLVVIALLPLRSGALPDHTISSAPFDGHVR